MYGLLLDSIQKFLREKYGERYWANIRRRAKLQNHWFVTHEVYSDSVMQDLVEAAAIELGEDRGTVMAMFGEYFVQNIGRYGYARLLRVLGRDLRDFLNGLDDLHEYLRFSYPKMRPPSFICENESPEGMLLHYTTKRRGYLNYVIGQLQTVGKIYGKDLEISIRSEDENEGETHVVLELRFDNHELLKQRYPSTAGGDFQIDSNTFLGVFPFCILFTQDMEIKRVGNKLLEVLPDVIGMYMNEAFTLKRPQFGRLTWNMICMHTNCVFEVLSTRQVTRLQQPTSGHSSPGVQDYSIPPPPLRLKGQMMVQRDLHSIIFLCSPAMDSPEDLYNSGIFINDLSMHDSSRDFILAGSQQNPELNLALNQEKIRSAQLEESIQRTDQLLYQMIPKPIADQLRNGETPLNTCQEFPSVSILFSDIVSFTPMCSRLRPMEVVCVLNAMYVAFDQLCEKHHVYKVETIGDAYMVICGAPELTPNHAEYVTEFAFSIIEATSKINDPSTSKSLKIRVGIHSGTVVAGVVGASILRYDVFGDTVNVAARMEATGEPMRIHVSEATAELLQDTNFEVVKRGRVEVKGKGLMDTYWVKSKKSGDSASQTMLNPFQRQKITDKLLKASTNQHLAKPTPTSPSHSRPSTPPHPTMEGGKFLSPVGQERNGITRVMSPKPDEWPIAEQRLSQLTLDNKHRGNGDRRYTLATLQCPPIVIQRQLAGPGGGGGLPLADASSLLDRRNTITTMDPREMQQAVIHSHPPGRASVSSANPVWSTVPLWNQSPPSPHDNILPETPRLTIPSELSEYNLLHVRDSLTNQLPPVIEGGGVSPSHLSVFASMAEETARQARRVADWASYIARASGASRNTSSDHLSNSDPGSSVDALLEEAAPKMCPLSQERGRRSKGSRQEVSDNVFEALNGMCPARLDAGANNRSSDQSETDVKPHVHRGQGTEDGHTNCNIM